MGFYLVIVALLAGCTLHVHTSSSSSAKCERDKCEAASASSTERSIEKESR